MYVCMYTRIIYMTTEINFATNSLHKTPTVVAYYIQTASYSEEDSKNVCMQVCMYVCMYVHIFSSWVIKVFNSTAGTSNIYVCMYVCMYV